jgi:hypothetical protein
MPENNKKILTENYETVMPDRNIFNEIVYTPLSEALKLLEERQKDPILIAKIEKLLNGDIPDILKKNKCAIFARQIATPNNESRRFISIAKENNLHPVFFEYHDDKFTPNNNMFKHSLAQICLQKKLDCNGNDYSKKITIVDFNEYSGKKIKNIKTLWSEPLISFHRKLFESHGQLEKDFSFYDGSDWYKRNGGIAINYYTNFLILFVCFGILFENFEITKNGEGDFTKNILLPSLEKVINLVGIKPIIVPLEPIDLEADSFWLHHLPNVKEFITKT